MAIGRHPGDPSAGMFGRASAAPQGRIGVRDPEAAEAAALREKVATYEAAGVPVPPYLALLLAGVRGPAGTPTMKLVEAATGADVAESWQDTQVREAADASAVVAVQAAENEAVEAAAVQKAAQVKAEKAAERK